MERGTLSRLTAMSKVATDAGADAWCNACLVASIDGAGKG